MVCFFAAAKVVTFSKGPPAVEKRFQLQAWGSVSHIQTHTSHTGSFTYIPPYLSAPIHQHARALCPQSLWILFAPDNLHPESHDVAYFLSWQKSLDLYLHITFSVNLPQKLLLKCINSIPTRRHTCTPSSLFIISLSLFRIWCILLTYPIYCLSPLLQW